MRPTIYKLILALCAVSWTAACPGPIVRGDALFRDVSRRPPDAAPDTIEALAKDPDFAVWVIYQDRACDRWGCAQ